MKILLEPMKILLMTVLCGATLTVASATSAATQNGRAVAEALDDRIEARFNSDATLKGQDIKVEVAGGVATLTGTVTTDEQRVRAGTLARVDGISRVDNRLVVDAGASKGIAQKAEDKTKAGIDKSIDATEHGLEKAGDALSKAGSEVSDAWILTTVKAKFVGEDLLKDSDINVDCDKRVVTLRGSVPTAAGRERAVQLARGVKGVRRVTNRLVVGPRKS